MHILPAPGKKHSYSENYDKPCRPAKKLYHPATTPFRAATVRERDNGRLPTKTCRIAGQDGILRAGC